MDEFLTPLVPVSEWVWHLFKVEYFKDETSEQALVTDYIVSSSDNHLVSDINERWPGDHATYYKYEMVGEDAVAEPKNIGSLYGIPISESGWSAGAREAEKRGLK